MFCSDVHKNPENLIKFACLVCERFLDDHFSRIRHVTNNALKSFPADFWHTFSVCLKIFKLEFVVTISRKMP